MVEVGLLSSYYIFVNGWMENWGDHTRSTPIRLLLISSIFLMDVLVKQYYKICPLRGSFSFSSEVYP